MYKKAMLYKSAVSRMIIDFISERKALGYRYQTEIFELSQFDRFLFDHGLGKCTLPKNLVRKWIQKKKHEAATTHRRRFGTVRQFALFMARQGYKAYVPDAKMHPIARQTFAPYIFSLDEIRRLIATVDAWPPCSRAPLRHVVMPELFRVLYCCGLRLGEALRLTLADLDLQQGMLTIRDSKFHKDRLVPMVPQLTGRLTRLKERLSTSNPDTPLFPNNTGQHYANTTIYTIFRKFLRACGIAHGGRGKGPRIHDLRHTFACHRMAKWYRENVDLTSKLAVLATYMGHRKLIGTQRYLHLTLELSSDLLGRLNKDYNHIIPRWKNQ